MPAVQASVSLEESPHSISGIMSNLDLRRCLRWRVMLPLISFTLSAIFLLSRNLGGNLIPHLPGNMGNRPSVTLRQGKILGREVQAGYPQALEAFLGIPYAQDTSGRNRFNPPVPVNSSTNEFDASHFGARCPAPPNDKALQGEDCLNLNIWRPKERDEKKMPVLVYFHGGSFNSGYGASRQISNMVAWSTEPMLGLSFNYRVGAFGFLPSKLTAKEGILNAGLKDQVQLLHWVKENIAAFGGDPDNVTIMGSSAGAHSIGHHLFYNVDKPPLFNRVIMESGAATARACYHPTFPLHKTQFQEFLTRLSLQDAPEDTLIPSLRALPTVDIKRASEAIWSKYDPSVRWPFQPVIDGPGGMIALPPSQAWKEGKYHQVPILTGYNTDEGSCFTPPSISTSKAFTAFFRTLLPGLTEEDLASLNELYPDPVVDPSSKYRETRKGLGAQFLRTAQAYGHFAYIAPVKQTAFYASQGPAPVYLYHFAASSSVRGGADHGKHAPFVTYNHDIHSRSASLKWISGTMNAYWTSFILTGDPNAVKGRFERPSWPRYSAEEGKGRVVVFGEGNDEVAGGVNGGAVVQVRDDGWMAKECGWWSKRVGKFEL